MAKKKNDDKQVKSDKSEDRRTDQVRTAVDQAFQQAVDGAQLTRERAQEIADELAAAAGRVREALDELRPPSGDDLRSLGDRLDALEARIAKLEAATKPAPARRTTARKPAAKKPATTRKPAAKRTTTT